MKLDFSSLLPMYRDFLSVSHTLMINKNNELVIIDFDRDDYGDPWEEFNRLVWSIQISYEFATGIVDGYFNKKSSRRILEVTCIIYEF